MKKEEIAQKLLKIFRGNENSSLRTGHRVALTCAITVYFLISVGFFSWIASHKAATIEAWNSRIPSVSTIIDVKENNPVEINESGISSTTPNESGKFITIIISDLGMSANITEKAIRDLPKEFVLAFSPYSDNLDYFMRISKQKEHENVLLLPMEDIDFQKNDSGPYSLSSRLSKKENSENLQILLDKSKNSVAIMNYMGAGFLKDKVQLSLVFDKLKESELGFIENIVTTETVAYDLAKQKELKYLSVDLTVDSEQNKEKFLNQLSELEKIADKNGFAIGIVEPYPSSVMLVKNWALDLNKRGFALASLSTLWKNIPHYER